MKIKLKNLLRRRRAFNLEHSSFVEAKGDNGKGKPEVLTVGPREIVEVPSTVLHCREIKSALKPQKGRPTLRVVK